MKALKMITAVLGMAVLVAAQPSEAGVGNRSHGCACCGR